MPETIIHRCPQCGEGLSFRPQDGVLRYCSLCLLPVTVVAGKYEIVRMLAKGGCGVLYVARHQRLQMDPLRVIKFIDSRFVDTLVARTRFAREVEVTSALSQRNQHIVRVYDDFGEIPGLGYFFVMEYLEGQDLAVYMQSLHRTMPMIQAIHILEQVGYAMQDAHRAGVVHRDLKPQNIFLLQRGQDGLFVKVIDFGIAKTQASTSQLGLTQGLLGTPAYMSPEQCSGRPVDHRADIYALGVILYQLVVGRLPFVGSTDDASAMQLAFAQITQPPPPPRSVRPDLSIPLDLEAIILKALAKDPERRHAGVGEFLQELALVKANIPEELSLVMEALPPLHTVPAVKEQEQAQVGDAVPTGKGQQPKQEDAERSLSYVLADISAAVADTQSSQKPLPTGDVEPTLSARPEQPKFSRVSKQKIIFKNEESMDSQHWVMGVIVGFCVLFFGGGVLWLVFFLPKKPDAPQKIVSLPRSVVSRNVPTMDRRPVQKPPTIRESVKTNQSMVVAREQNRVGSGARPKRTIRAKKRSWPKSHNGVRNRNRPEVTRSSPAQGGKKKVALLSPQHGVQGCPADSISHVWIRLDVVPPQAELRTLHLFEKRQGWFCLRRLKHTRSLLVTLLLEGYSPCSFFWPTPRRMVRAVLKREGNSDELSPPQRYCLR